MLERHRDIDSYYAAQATAIEAGCDRRGTTEEIVIPLRWIGIWTIVVGGIGLTLGSIIKMLA